jgi:uncharacterized protein YcnI
VVELGRDVLRVPNEKDVPTTRVEITFPADIRVISFVEVPGWRLETRADSTGRIVAATWTGRSRRSGSWSSRSWA